MKCKAKIRIDCVDCGFCLCDVGEFEKYVEYLDDVESRAEKAVYKK